MIKYNTKTINDWNFDASNIVKVYHNGAVCYYKLEGSPTPTAQTPCYAVVDDITQYQDTEFEDVYDKATEKWYKLNNLNQYEEYGVYGSGRTICSAASFTELTDIIAQSTTALTNHNITVTPAVGALSKIRIDTTKSATTTSYTWATFTPTPSGSEVLGINMDNIGVMNGYGNNKNYVTDANGSQTFAHWVDDNNTIVEIDIAELSNNQASELYLLMYQENCNPAAFSFYMEAANCVTTYEGKLTIDDGYEYVYSGGSWVNLGEVSGSSKTSDFKIGDIDTPITNDASLITDGMYGVILPVSLSANTSSASALMGSSDSNTLSNLSSHTKTSVISENDIIDYAVWKFHGTATANTFYVENVATKKYFGYANVSISYMPLVDESSKVPTVFSAFTYNNVTAIGICKGNTPNKYYAINDLYGYHYEYNWFNLLSRAGDLNNSYVIYKMKTSDAEYPLYYTERQDPPTELTFNTMEEALAYQCPYVGVVATINGVLYYFNSNYEWERLNFTITGVTTSSNAFDIKLNMQSESVTIYKDNGDGTYDWGIYYPNAITNVTNMCSGNTALTSFDWGTANTTGLTGLSNSFYNCSGLTSMPSIPSNVTEIGSSTFYNCRNMNNGGTIEIPEGVQKIGNNAFYNVFQFNSKSLKLPSTLNYIYSGAFTNKAYLSNLYITDLSSFCKINFGATSSTVFNGSSTYLYVNNSQVTNVAIPNDITTLSSYTFYNAARITGVTIPSSVTKIGGSYTFQYSGLKNVTVPSSVTSWGGSYTFANCTSLTAATLNNTGVIGGHSFESCTSLTSITFGNNITAINSYSFKGCTALKTLTIPSNVTVISTYAFSGCTSLESITLNGTTPPSIESNTFQNVPDTCIFYVPCSAVNAYRTASVWSTYASQILGFESCTEYDWQVVSGEYICYQGDKYEKTKKVRSFDGGTTWEDVTPIEYQRGELIESGSQDCASRLPNGYTEVEYVQNTGTSYLNTNFVPNQDTRVICDMQNVTASNYPRLWGAGAWNSATGLMPNYEGGYLQMSWLGKTSWTQYTSVPTSFDRKVYDVNKNYLYVDSVQIGSNTYTTRTASDPIGVFTYIGSGRPSSSSYWGQEHFKGKMYSFKVYDNGTLVRDLVPCIRDNDNTVGAYDIVNDVFYTVPSGYTTDKLVAGPTV